ncbi:MAG: flagellar biosynthesis protein FlhF [Phycisphaerales bacterium]
MANVSLKTYQAPTMAEALTSVKRELGKDAVILHTRSFKVGGVLGLFRRNMVEITASVGVGIMNPGDLRRAARAAETPASSTAEAKPTAVSASAPPRPPSALARAYGLTTPAPSPSLRAASATRADPQAERSAREEIARENQHVSGGLSADLKQELAAIRTMVGQVLQSSSARAGEHGGAGLGAPGIAMPDALLKFYLQLIQNDVAREIADQVVSDIRDELTPGELRDEGVVRASFLRHVETLIPVDEGLTPPRPAPDGRPLTIALVGPTGVGKTTTLAKLAAAYRLRHARKIGLITADTFRIAAVDQLRTYANIIGVPLEVVGSPDEMALACERFAGMDAILIDTAGRSPTDTQSLEELAAFLAAARPHRTHLVLASVANEPTLVRTIERFSPLKPTGMIFTKLDEAASVGVLLSVIRRVDAKLSFVTTGQGVPDDIEPGRPDRLARLILDGTGWGVASSHTEFR